MKRALALTASSILVAGSGVGIALAAPAQAVTTNTTATDWAQAAAKLGIAGSLWAPGRTLGLPLTGPISVVSDNLVFASGVPTAGDTAASGRYGTAKRGFTLLEKWANTGWAADPAPSTERAPVGTATIRLGEPGTQITVKARISADCFPQPSSANPKPVPAGLRCTKADVKTHGGTLTMTAVPASTMTAPGNTSIVIQSTGLSYSQLLHIASHLQQVNGAFTDQAAGSAQQQAMCEQMIDGRMTLAQAQAFSTANGYGTVRASSIDGAPQALTMDYRPDRFNVDLVNQLVTACTYA